VRPQLSPARSDVARSAASTSGAGPQRSAKSSGRAAAPASGGKAAGAKGGRTKRAPVTADQLDAEMEVRASAGDTAR